MFALSEDNLAGLAGHLRSHGFQVATQQCVAAQHLMVRLAAAGQLPGDPRGLSSRLGPVFCGTAEEQRRFPALLDEWCRAEFPALAPPPSDPRVPDASRRGPRSNPFLRSRGPWTAAVALIVVAGAWLGWRLYESSRASTEVVLRTNARTNDPGAGPGPGPGVSRSVTNAARVSMLTAVTFDRAIAIPRTWPVYLSWADRLAGRIVLGLMACGLVGFVWRWGSRRSGRMAVERVLGETPRTLRVLDVGEGARHLLPGLGVREVARELRRRRVVHSRELDVPATLTATLRHGGMPTPVFGSRAEPDYLVLVDRASLKDHQAALAEVIVQSLEAGNVSVERWDYDGDPRVCRHPQWRRRASLDELFARHPEHRVLMFGDGGNFFDEFTGEPASWVAAIAGWKEKAILTPEPVARWSLREQALEKLGLVPLPLSRAGLATLAELFRDRPPERPWTSDDGRGTPLFARTSNRWLERQSPRPEVVDRLCDDLRSDLDVAGFRWLAACAVYPEVHWGLTVRLGASLVPDQSEFETLLPRLARLIWLREGFVPDWLRDALLSRLEPETEDRIRLLLAGLLEQSTSGGENPVGLRIAIDSPTRPRRRWLRGAARAPAGTPLADHVFLRFISGGQLTRLQVRLPERVARLLYPQGIPALGMRRMVVAGAAVFLVAAVLLLSPKMFVPRGTYSVAFNPNGKQIAIAESNGKVRLVNLGATNSERSAMTLVADAARTAPIVFDAEGRVLATLDRARTGLQLWESETGSLIRRIRSPDGLLSSLALHPSGGIVAAGSDAKVVRLWDTSDGRLLRVLEGHQGEVLSVAFDSSGRWLASGGLDRSVRIWETRSGTLLQTLPFGSAVTALAFDRSGQTLAAGGLDLEVRLWAVATWKLRAGSSAPLHVTNAVSIVRSPERPSDLANRPAVTRLAFDPSGATLMGVVTGRSENAVRFWAAGDLRLLDSLTSEAEVLRGAALSHSGRLLAVSDRDEGVRLWSLAYSGGLKALLIGCDYQRRANDPPTQLRMNQMSPGASPIGALNSSVRDVRALAEVFADRYGMSTTTLENPDGAAARKALRELAESSATNDSVVLVLSGHGLSDKSGFQFPFDAERIVDPLTQAELCDYLRALPAREVFVIVDAVSAWNLIGGAAVRSDNPGSKIRVALTSDGRDGALAVDGFGTNHSPFVAALLESLRGESRAISSSRLAELVTRNMGRRGQTKQSASYGALNGAGHTKGEFALPPPLEDVRQPQSSPPYDRATVAGRTNPPANIAVRTNPPVRNAIQTNAPIPNVAQSQIKPAMANASQTNAAVSGAVRTNAGPPAVDVPQGDLRGGAAPANSAGGAQADPSIHYVRRGESLKALAIRFGVTPQEIIERNRLETETLRPGQRLVIPPPDKAAAK